MNNRNIFLFLLFITLGTHAWGQSLYDFWDAVKFQKTNGALYCLPLSGGFQNPNFLQADINGDALLDLVVFERYPKKLVVFLKNNTSGSTPYTYAPALDTIFPSYLKDYLLFRDMNCDGIPDLIDRGNGGVRLTLGARKPNGMWYYTTRKELSYFNTTQGINGGNIYVNPNGDIPLIADVDKDGDMDILAFDIIMPNLIFYKNTKIENNYACDSNTFLSQSWCYGGVARDNSNWRFNISCKTGGIDLPDPGKVTHGTSVCLCDLDFNGDNDVDILSGSYDTTTMPLLYNTGTALNPIYNTQDHIFNDQSGEEIIMNKMPCPFPVDYNLDGKKDLIVANNQTNTWNNQNYILLQNTQGNSPVYMKDTTSPLYNMTIDLGANAYPVFFDMDQDGDQDLLVGSGTTYNKLQNIKGRLAYYNNIGTASAPLYQLVSEDYLGLSAQNLSYLNPAFGDINNDGKIDLLIGHELGMVYFKNMATSTSQALLFSAPVVLSFPPVDSAKSVNSGRPFKRLSPFFYDLNKDGYKDIVMGEKYGNIFYFENRKHADSIDFTLNSLLMGGIDVSGDNDPFFNSNTSWEGCSVPWIGKVDETDSVYLLVGNLNGQILRYENLADFNSTMPLKDTLLKGEILGKYTSITLADLYSDNKKIVLLGNSYGGLNMLKRMHDATVNIKNVIKWNPQIYPNPTSNHWVIDMPLSDQHSITSYRLTDEIGRCISQEKVTTWPLKVGYQELTPGVYWLTMSSKDDESQSFTLLKQ